MSPLRDYMCGSCGHILYDTLVRTASDVPTECPHCDETKMECLISAPGGYTINGNNSASTRPRGAGSPKRAKQ